MKAEKVLLGGRKKAFPTDIIYLKGEVNYCTVFFADGKRFLTSTTLKILENRLQNYGFFRTHKSSLINLNFIMSYENMPSKGIIMLKNNKLIEVSRRKNKILRTLI